MSCRASRIGLAVTILVGVAGLTWAGVDVWTPVGPAGASMLMTLAIDPSSPNTLYAGFPLDRGVWKTTDAGNNWVSRSVGLPPNFHVLALAASPVDSNVVFAVLGNRQVYKSTDGGGTWSLSSGGMASGTAGAGSIVFQPGAPDTMYVTAGGSLFKSTDGGANWVSPNPITDTGVSKLVATASPALYAALGVRGIYKSTDGALTWSPASNGLPCAVAEPYNYNTPEIAADPINPNLLYTPSRRDGKVYKTTDGAANWSVVSTEAYGFGALWVQSGTGHLFASGNDYLGASPTYRDCVFRSTDGGVTFSNLTPTKRNAGQIVLHPTNAMLLYAFMNEGIYKSVDGGTNWSAAYGTMRIYDANVAFAPSLPSTYWAGFWGAMGKTEDGGATFTIMTPSAALPYGERFAIHPTDPNIVITDAYNGCYNNPGGVLPCTDSSLIRTTDGGGTWSRVPNPLYPDDWGLGQVWGLLYDPADASIVYALSPAEEPGVYKSIDGGLTFAVAGGIGTLLWPNTLVAAPTNPTNLYMGTGPTYGGTPGIWRSTDHAASWQLITTGLPASPNVRSIVVQPTTATRLYIAIQAATDSGFYTSGDGGDTWSKLAGAGLPDNAGGFSLAIDPTAPHVLYAGVWGAIPGVYRSTDGGASWTLFSTGLDSLVIWNLTIDPANHNHVLAGTRAGLWEITAVPRTLTVSKSGSGSGTVTSTPAGISCGTTCSAGFAEGTIVTLTASPAGGSVSFTGWSGACSGTGSCVVTMDAAKSVTATFALLLPRGDVNGNGTVEVGDIFYLINHLFAAGPAPVGSGDVNGNGTVEVGDIFYLINYLFAGGPAPIAITSPAVATLAKPYVTPLTLSFGEPQARGGDRVGVPVYLEGDTRDVTAIALQVRVRASSARRVQIARAGATADRQAIFSGSPRGAESVGLLVKFGQPLTGSGTETRVLIAEVSVDTGGGEAVKIELDPALSAASDSTAHHLRSVANGSLHLGSGVLEVGGRGRETRRPRDRS
jgi:photosystem II stability/assembly factor-like uncharacterized protein